LCFPRSISSVDHCKSLMQTETPAYKRIVLKLSGEAVQERGGRDNISPTVVHDIAERIKEVRDLGVQVSVVIGGGNIWRGLSASHRGMDRTTADYMGMLATVINALALRSALDQMGVETRVQSAIDMRNVAEPFILGRAIRHLELGRIVIFAAGTGNPYFSTDTTAALRASEIRADVILKATKVDGVYDRDPNKHPDARRFDQLTFSEALAKRLQIMDSTAFSLCMDNKIPIVVFDMNNPTNIRDAVLGRKVGTLVCDELPSKYQSSDMNRDDILLEAEMSMEKSVDYMVHEFAAVRTGKASPGLVENVDVHAYGSTMKLKQLALITTPEARLLVVQPFDAGTVQDIERALKESRIGITPAVDGKIIRLPIPELSEERRKELVRSLGKMAEEARVRVRANRRTALDEAKKLKAAGELTEDQLRDVEEEVQKLTDRFVKSVDDHLKHKEADVMKV